MAAHRLSIEFLVSLNYFPKDVLLIGDWSFDNKIITKCIPINLDSGIQYTSKQELRLQATLVKAAHWYTFLGAEIFNKR